MQLILWGICPLYDGGLSRGICPLRILKKQKYRILHTKDQQPGILSHNQAVATKWGICPLAVIMSYGDFVPYATT